MHQIEPFYLWKDYYDSSEDANSPFYGRMYDEFYFNNTIYNFYIHPQWDDFGSSTLYLKVLYCDYDTGFAVLELIGEWNDCLHNDIMYLKENVINPMMDCGVSKFLLICENVLNFHGSDDCYYEQWYEDAADDHGWVAFVNLLEHVEAEMIQTRVHDYVRFVQDFNWRKIKPANMCQIIETQAQERDKELY